MIFKISCYCQSIYIGINAQNLKKWVYIYPLGQHHVKSSFGANNDDDDDNENYQKKLSKYIKSRLKITINYSVMVTCMALTAPQEADMVESLSKVTELGRFCTITCSEDHHHFFKGKVAKDNYPQHQDWRSCSPWGKFLLGRDCD